jgi:hypothetical protein
MSIVSSKLSFSCCYLFLLLLALPTMAAEQKDWKRFRFELEGGPVWQAKNDVQIPGNTGTEFSFKDLTGSGPYAAGRFTFDWNFLERHGLRLEVAPLRFDGTGTLIQPVSFAGTTFSPGTSTEGKYKFDTYRVSYRWLFLNGWLSRCCLKSAWGKLPRHAWQVLTHNLER